MGNEDKKIEPILDFHETLLNINQKLDLLVSVALKYDSIIKYNQSKSDERKLPKAE